mmetsp:Transcript_13787/g.39288  ORF Transcript_13787/g.39288 Transcript_13787/m.39288 type:complete len:93 (+) Transcript_13787:42-320(+)
MQPHCVELSSVEFMVEATKRRGRKGSGNKRKHENEDRWCGGRMQCETTLAGDNGNGNAHQRCIETTEQACARHTTLREPCLGQGICIRFLQT